MMNMEMTNSHRPVDVIKLPSRRSSEAVSSVTVRVRESGPWTVVEVDGEMDIQVVALVADLLGPDRRCVVFELDRVTFMDAVGLGLMVDIQCRAFQTGGSVRLVAPSRSVRRLLMLTGCARTFPTFDSLDQAVSIPPVDMFPPPAA